MTRRGAVEDLSQISLCFVQPEVRKGERGQVIEGGEKVISPVELHM